MYTLCRTNKQYLCVHHNLTFDLFERQGNSTAADYPTWHLKTDGEFPACELCEWKRILQRGITHESLRSAQAHASSHAKGPLSAFYFKQNWNVSWNFSKTPNIKSDENRFSRYQACRRRDGWIYVRKDVIFSKFDTDKRMIQTVIQILCVWLSLT